VIVKHYYDSKHLSGLCERDQEGDDYTNIAGHTTCPYCIEHPRFPLPVMPEDSEMLDTIFAQAMGEAFIGELYG
jgi:hypothetical protein